MRRPDPRIVGPVQASLDEIDALNRVFADAFTDRYHRDGMTGVRVPHLSRRIWQYAIEDAGDGAMVWHDGSGQVAAFNMVHRSGTEGWMGPLCVRPSLQGLGLGRRVVEAGIAWLRRAGARVIGLETMPRTIENIGFYSRLGFVPGHLTVTLVKDLEGEAPSGGEGERLPPAGEARAAAIRRCAGLTERVVPGLDFSGVIELTERLRLGGTTMTERQGALAAFCMWHTVALAEGRPSEELRVLKLVAEDLDAFRDLLRAAQAAAGSAGVRRLSVRCQSAYAAAYAALLGDGYQVHWTDLRMTLAGAEERVRAPGIVMSNWEI